MTDKKIIAISKPIKAKERRAKALELRKEGLTYQQIGNELGITRQSAHQTIKTAMGEIKEFIDSEAKLIVALELERLDSLQLALWRKAMNGNCPSVQQILKIMERRAKLLGLDSSIKIEPINHEEYLNNRYSNMTEEEIDARIEELELQEKMAKR